MDSQTPFYECGGCNIIAQNSGFFDDDYVRHDKTCEFYKPDPQDVLVYLADSPPYTALMDSNVLTEWLNEKARDGWRFICVNGTGQYIFNRQ